MHNLQSDIVKSTKEFKWYVHTFVRQILSMEHTTHTARERAQTFHSGLRLRDKKTCSRINKRQDTDNRENEKKMNEVNLITRRCQFIYFSSLKVNSIPWSVCSFITLPTCTSTVCTQLNATIKAKQVERKGDRHRIKIKEKIIVTTIQYVRINT